MQHTLESTTCTGSWTGRGQRIIKCIPHRLNFIATIVSVYGGPYKVCPLLSVCFSVTFSCYIQEWQSTHIITLVGIFTFWSFTKGLTSRNIKHISSEHCYFARGLSNTNQGMLYVLCCCLRWHPDWWNFDFKKIKRKLGFKYQPGYVALPQVASDEDVEEERPPESPPPIVNGSCREGHHFMQGSPPPNAENIESPSPLLLAREPLLFDT